MKRLLAIGLVLLVYGVGFCGTPPRVAPTVPMAPGVTNPGAHNLDNPDVPHEGDSQVGVAEDQDGFLYFAFPNTIRTEDDGEKTMIVMVVNPNGDPRYGGAHRLVGRAHFKCQEGTHMAGDAYVLDDEGAIIHTDPSNGQWKPTEEDTPADVLAGIACGAIKLTPGQQSTHEKKPNVTEL